MEQAKNKKPDEDTTGKNLKSAYFNFRSIIYGQSYKLVVVF